jgi:hypothetical protein
VKARFDGGKITSDAGVLLLREVEQRTGLVAGLTACDQRRLLFPRRQLEIPTKGIK